MTAAEVHTGLVQALALAAFAVVVVASARELVRRARAATPRDRLAVVALVVLAGAVRAAVPPGIGETNVRTGSVFQGVLPHLWGYGAALPTIQRVLLLPVPHPGPSDVFALGLAFGVLGVVATAALVREAGATRGTALLAGLLLALSPVHARFSHTDAPGVFESPLFLVGLIAWLRHAARPEGGAWRVAGPALGLAAACRPEALLLLPLVPAASLAAGRPIPWRDRRTWGAVALAVGLLGLHVAGVLLHNPPAGPDRAGLSGLPAPLAHGWRHFVALSPAFSSPVVALASLVGALVGPPPWRQRLGWTLLALGTASFVLDPTWSPAYVGAVNAARHQVRSLPFFAALAAQGAVAVGARLGPARALPAASVVLASAWSCRDLPVTNTAHADYAFLVEALPRVPDGCTVAAFIPPDDRGFTPSGPLLSWAAGRRHDWLDVLRGDEALPSGCVVWYRTSNCDTIGTDGARATACDRFEAAHRLRPLAEASLPARPWSFEIYGADPIRVGLYEVEAPPP